MLSRDQGALPTEDAARSPEGHRRGLLLAGAAVVLLSPDALVVRTVGTDVWTTLFWRGSFTAAGIAILVAAIRARRRNVREGSRGRPGPAALLAGVFFAGATIAFVSAVRRTDAANVFVVVGAGPLIAAMLGRAALREAVPPRTWAACAIVAVGLAGIFSGSVRRGSLDGDLLALVGSTCFASYLTVVRAVRPTDMTPAIGAGGAIVGVAALVAGADLGPPAGDLALLALLGLVVLPVSLALTTRAARYLQAPEVGLVTRLESLLAPVWIWLALGEVPSPDVVAAGVLVLAAVAGHSTLALRPPRVARRPGRSA